MFNDINLDPDFVKSNINTLIDWAQKDTRNRKVKIEIEYGEINILVYDFLSVTSVYLKNTDKISSADDIDNILKAEKEKEERAKYEELKAKFEKKEGELGCKEQQLA